MPVVAQLGRGLLELVRPARRDRDAVAVLAERARDREPDAARATGDQRRFVRQLCLLLVAQRRLAVSARSSRPQHLAERVARQLVAQVHLARDLEAGEVLAAKRMHLLARSGRCPGAGRRTRPGAGRTARRRRPRRPRRRRPGARAAPPRPRPGRRSRRPRRSCRPRASRRTGGPPRRRGRGRRRSSCPRTRVAVRAGSV